jgi:hypothetical protein
MERCDLNSDCPTDEDGVNVDCLCGLNASGDKYWDYGPADFLWVKAMEKFRLYYVQSLGCHGGTGWGRWSADDEWEEWKCADAKANYAVETSANPDCVNSDVLNIPAIRTLEKYWGSNWRDNYLEDDSDSFSPYLLIILANYLF